MTHGCILPASPLQKNGPRSPRCRSEAGNVIVFVLLAIVLIGLVTAALRGGGLENANIDQETIMINSGRIKSAASEYERAVAFIMQNGASEEDIRFAHALADAAYGNMSTTPEFQVFHPQGGGAEYRMPPGGVNGGENWQFYGHTSLPGVGSDRPELIAVLPNISQTICQKINQDAGYDSSTQPADPGTGTGCINAGAANGFAGTYSDGSPNVPTAASFTITAASMGCVYCSNENQYHYFHVLMAR